MRFEFLSRCGHNEEGGCRKAKENNADIVI